MPEPDHDMKCVIATEPSNFWPKLHCQQRQDDTRRRSQTVNKVECYILTHLEELQRQLRGCKRPPQRSWKGKRFDPLKLSEGALSHDFPGRNYQNRSNVLASPKKTIYLFGVRYAKKTIIREPVRMSQYFFEAYFKGDFPQNWWHFQKTLTDDVRVPRYLPTWRVSSKIHGSILSMTFSGPYILNYRAQLLMGVWVWTWFLVPGPERRVQRFRCFRNERR